jgi:hypothetical protein
MSGAVCWSRRGAGAVWRLVALLLSLAPALPSAAQTAGPPPFRQSPFGIVCPWGGLKDLGGVWVRCGAGATSLGNWATIDKAPGRFDWTASDTELAGVFAAEYLTPLCILGYTPDWLADGATDKSARPPRD